MEILLHIYKNGEKFKKESLYFLNGKYMYKWANVDLASYSFEIEISNKIYAITYNHTSPFASEFRAYADLNSNKKEITGFQEGIDILIDFNIKDFTFTLYKKNFLKFNVNFSKKYNKVEIAGDFNNWEVSTEPLRRIDDFNYEIILDVSNGYYNYKYLVDSNWYPETNQILVVGENGRVFEEGKLGSGTLSYDVKEDMVAHKNLKAILHDSKDLNYFNKITEKEFEFTIRTQLLDVQRVYVAINSDKFNKIYELERNSNFDTSFDYFKRWISLPMHLDEFEYYFILEDGGKKFYYGKNLLEEKLSEKIKFNNKNDISFYIPYWAREAIWYNIFPDRFYNSNKYNDPLFNELGPGKFSLNSNSEFKFIEKYRWNKEENSLLFELNRWTSDFSERKKWEIEMEKGVNYSFKYARMYGGDLKGIKEKIPYLKNLGINAIWLNPVFFSYQNHKYGANDYRHISPDLGTISTSGNLYNIKFSKDSKNYVDVLKKDAINRSELELLELDYLNEVNGFKESDDPSTWVWTESDLIMVDLIKELHKNEIRVIFDGVFNHSSNFFFAFNDVLARGSESKYFNWYRFTDISKHIPINENMSKEEINETLNLNRKNMKYICWAGFETLPEFNTFNQEWKEYIFNITRKWMLGPDGKASKKWQEDDGIDGWRLDVPNCLQNQTFWKEWRCVVKDCKKDSYITAELWNNASGDINSGDKFDATMNYEWLKSVISYFISVDDRKLSPERFFNELKYKLSWYPLQVSQANQNLNGSHDTDRLYSRIINDKLGNNLEEGKQLEKGYNGIRPDLASNYHPNTSIDWINSEIKPKDILKLISIFQMTYIGAPMIYYGDEVAMWGATDPYCRKPMLWQEFWHDSEKNPSIINRNETYEQIADLELFNWYKKIIQIRKEHKALVYGKIKLVYFDNEKDILVFERYSKEESLLVIINNSFKDYREISFKNYHVNKVFLDLLSGKKIVSDNNGMIKIDIKAKKAYILYTKKIND